MTSPSDLLYTNELTPELLCALETSPFTQQQLSTFNDQAMAIVTQQQTFAKAHPPIAIYRMAAEGSQTRRGGVVKQATGSVEFKLDNDQQVRAARTGDYVVYPDGAQAQIITGAGKGNNNVALVGSYLSNGDEIINTPQGAALIIRRKGVEKAKDFLPPFEKAASTLGTV